MNKFKADGSFLEKFKQKQQENDGEKKEKVGEI